MSEVIGNQNEAYNIGRTELLAWLNETLQLNYTKIEDVANGLLFFFDTFFSFPSQCDLVTFSFVTIGAAFCQIMDATFPGKVPLGRVNFNASLPHQVTQNYKVLQQIFSRYHVSKDMDVDKLQRGLFQDNLEFLQWIKHYHDVTTTLNPGEYKARERRKACGCEEPKCNTNKAGAKRPAPKASTSAVTKRSRPAATSSSSVATRSKPQAAAAVQKATRSTTKTQQPPSTEDQEELKAIAESHCDEVTVQQFADLKVSYETMEKERDFYYGKLRAVEDLCQTVLAEQSEVDDSAETASASSLTAFVNQVIAILFVIMNKQINLITVVVMMLLIVLNRYKKDDGDMDDENEETEEHGDVDANDEPLVV